MKFRRALRLMMERLVEREVIGQPECPMMLRWTFLDLGFLKAMIHYFPPEVSDRDPHDHPRSFVTFVLRGNYRDESWPEEPGFWARQASPTFIPPFAKLKTVERVRAGAIKFRRANHTHIVETDEVGCWTLVIMGPVERDWGFVRLDNGIWWPFKEYIDRWGGVARCDAPPDTMGRPPVAAVEKAAEAEAHQRGPEDYHSQHPRWNGAY